MSITGNLSENLALGNVADIESNFHVRDAASGLVIDLKTSPKGSLLQTADFGAGDVDWGNVQYLSYNSPLTGIVDDSFPIVGELDTLEAGLTGDYSTQVSYGNEHVGLVINSITGSGNVTITGTSIVEEDGIPTTGDTESFLIDSVASYQSPKKWLEVDSVVFAAGITAIDYDLVVLGYLDLSNNDFVVAGYRADIRSQSNTADVSIEIIKVKELADNKYELIYLEQYGIDSSNGGGGIVDGVRTGGDDRSHTFGSTAFPNNRMFSVKQGDFYPYFGEECRCLGANKGEGIIIRLAGTPFGTGITGIDTINLGIAIIKTT